ncbi:MAG TPA: glycosyltransferase family 9 protein [Candidatus Aquabacterium excrementipullorum]|nr:glycosyltransferase family 9 protein [Candidatus Aquabacterium excrementipullorum]
MMSAVPVRRILVIRLSALGDVVMSSGLIPALRSLYPDAHIAWLTQSAAAPLLRHNPRLDEVVIWPRERWQSLWKQRQWRALWREIRAFRALLRSHQYDLVLDAQGLLKSGLCAWLTNAPRRVGLISREGSHLLVHERIEPPADADVRIGAEYRFLARYLGAQDSSYVLDLAVGAEPLAQARQALSAHGVRGAYVVLCPFTTRPQKHWFEDRWAALAGELLGRGLTPVMLGGPDDREAAGRIALQCPGLVNLVGGLKLDASVAAVSEAALLIGVDTGLTHMGSARAVPTLALFGSTRPYLDAAQPSTVILYDQLSCSPCRRHPTCEGAFTCMRQFTVARVLLAAEALLQGDPSR